MLLTCSLALVALIAPPAVLASSESVDSFLSGKSDTLRGVDCHAGRNPSTEPHIVDDGPIIRDYRAAPSNDPGFNAPAGWTNGFPDGFAPALLYRSPSLSILNPRAERIQGGFSDMDQTRPRVGLPWYTRPIPQPGNRFEWHQWCVPATTAEVGLHLSIDGSSPSNCLTGSKKVIDDFVKGRTKQLCGYDPF